MSTEKVKPNNKGRKPDWDKKPESRIGVPYELAQPAQKKAIVETWKELKEAGLDFTHLAAFVKHGIHFIEAQSSPHPENRLCRKYSIVFVANTRSPLQQVLKLLQRQKQTLEDLKA